MINFRLHRWPQDRGITTSGHWLEKPFDCIQLWKSASCHQTKQVKNYVLNIFSLSILNCLMLIILCIDVYVIHMTFYFSKFCTCNESFFQVPHSLNNFLPRMTYLQKMLLYGELAMSQLPKQSIALMEMQLLKKQVICYTSIIFIWWLCCGNFYTSTA